MRRLRGLLPTFFKIEFNLLRIRLRFPQVHYVWSSDVSLRASLGSMVGIGKDVVINDNVTVGDYSYINRGAIIFSGSIGRFCSIAHYSQIGAEQHPVRHLSTSPYIYGRGNIIGASCEFDEFPSPPIIGSDVWIGSAAVIMQGVTVGNGAIVASGAVVTKDVEPFTIVAGVPARKIGERFDPETRSRIEGMAWWEWPEVELAKIAPLIVKGESFADYLDQDTFFV